jgi:hypothetical protein
MMGCEDEILTEGQDKEWCVKGSATPKSYLQTVYLAMVTYKTIARARELTDRQEDAS